MQGSFAVVWVFRHSHWSEWAGRRQRHINPGPMLLPPLWPTLLWTSSVVSHVPWTGTVAMGQGVLCQEGNASVVTS